MSLGSKRQNIILAVSLQQFPTKFCITTRHLDFSLFPCRRTYTNKANVPADLQSAGI